MRVVCGFRSFSKDVENDAEHFTRQSLKRAATIVPTTYPRDRPSHDRGIVVMGGGEGDKGRMRERENEEREEGSSRPVMAWGGGECVVGESFFLFLHGPNRAGPPPPGHRRRVFPSLGTHARTMRAI